MKTNATALSVLALAYCIPCACSFQRRPTSARPPPVKAARNHHQTTGNSASPENVTHEGGASHRCFRTTRRKKVARTAMMQMSSVDESEEFGDLDRNEVPVDEWEKLFQRRLEQLAEFVSVHGHGSIPTPYDDDPSLGVWAANVRRQYVLRIEAEENESHAPYTGYLTPSRMARLKRAGFDFLSLTEAQFRLRLAELEEFKEEYGHCMVPQNWDGSPGLGMWVLNIRKLYKRLGTEGRSMPRFSHLSDERIKLLNEMGFVWNLDDHRWLTMLEWAKVYGAVSRHLYMPKGDGSVSRDDNQININREVLEERHRSHVDDILDQGVPTMFHRQEDVLSLLTGDESHSEAFTPSCLHYSVSPNDEYHRPLRNWMTSQRSFHKNPSEGDTSSATNRRRRETLESIHFPWSGRFPNLVEEVRHRERREAETRRLREVEERRRKREIEERARINKILSKPIDEDDGIAARGSMSPEDQKKIDDDLMALWGAEDDDDGEW